MIVGVPTERAPGEHRVALTPDAVQRLAQRDLTVLLEPGAGAGASLPDDAYREAGAEIASSAEDVYARADIVVRIGRVEPAEVAALRSGHGAGRLAPAARRSGAGAGAHERRSHRLRDGVRPARDPRAADGRALVAGDGLRLSRRHPRRRGAAEVLPDADDRGGHGAAGQGARARRRRRRPPGDRDRPPPRRRRLGVRHAPGRQGAGAEPGRGVRGARDGDGRGQDERGYATALSESSRSSSSACSSATSPTPTSSSRPRSCPAGRRRG